MCTENKEDVTIHFAQSWNEWQQSILLKTERALSLELGNSSDFLGNINKEGVLKWSWELAVQKEVGSWLGGRYSFWKWRGRWIWKMYEMKESKLGRRSRVALKIS